MLVMFLDRKQCRANIRIGKVFQRAMKSFYSGAILMQRFMGRSSRVQDPSHLPLSARVSPPQSHSPHPASQPASDDERGASEIRVVQTFGCVQPCNDLLTRFKQ